MQFFIGNSIFAQYACRKFVRSFGLRGNLFAPRLGFDVLLTLLLYGKNKVLLRHGNV